MSTPAITTSLATRAAAMIAALTTEENSELAAIADPATPLPVDFLKNRTFLLNNLKAVGQFSGDVFAPLDSGAAYASSPRASTRILATEPAIPVLRVPQKAVIDVPLLLDLYRADNLRVVRFVFSAFVAPYVQRDIINPITNEHVGFAVFSSDPQNDFCVPFDIIDGSIHTLVFETRWSDDATPAIQTHLSVRSAELITALAAQERLLFAGWNGTDAPTDVQAEFLKKRIFALTSLAGLGQFTDDVFGSLNVGGPSASILGYRSVPVTSVNYRYVGMSGYYYERFITNPDPLIGNVGKALFGGYGMEYFAPWDFPGLYPRPLLLEYRWSDQ